MQTFCIALYYFCCFRLHLFPICFSPFRVFPLSLTLSHMYSETVPVPIVPRASRGSSRGSVISPESNRRGSLSISTSTALTPSGSAGGRRGSVTSPDMLARRGSVATPTDGGARRGSVLGGVDTASAGRRGSVMAAVMFDAAFEYDSTDTTLPCRRHRMGAWCRSEVLFFVTFFFFPLPPTF